MSYYHRPTSSAVANFFFEKAEKDKVPLTTMKLNKLVYFAYGWALAVLNEKLFDEPIEAWKYGPVIPSLYHEFKHYGSEPIDKEMRSIEFDAFNEEGLKVPNISNNNPELYELLSKVWELYKGQTATNLMLLTHEPSSPWSEVFDNNKPQMAILDQNIKTYFTNKIKELIADAE